MAENKMVGVVLALIIIGVAAPASAQLKKIRSSNSAIVSIAELPFKVAQVKEFYRESVSMSKRFSFAGLWECRRFWAAP